MSNTGLFVQSNRLNEKNIDISTDLMITYFSCSCLHTKCYSCKTCLFIHTKTITKLSK